MAADPTLLRLSLSVNGRSVEPTVPAERLLIDVLRLDLGLTGTKLNCGIGVCGACSVLVDGRLMSACLVLAANVDGASVTTIEGLAPDADAGDLTDVQHAFLTEGGFQCGFCTPGQVVAATALLDERPTPSEAEVVEWMSGNLCRCTGYGGIVRAVRAAAAARAADGRSAADAPAGTG